MVSTGIANCKQTPARDGQNTAELSDGDARHARTALIALGKSPLKRDGTLPALG